jgi:hypothetical protein
MLLLHSLTFSRLIFYVAENFKKLVRAMVPITTDSTLHDTAHSLSEHLRRSGLTPSAPHNQPPPGRAGAGMSAGASAAETVDFCSAERGSCVREYHPFATAATTEGDVAAVGQAERKGILSETLDIGHRHFSTLHWVYPSNFLPSDDADEVARLYKSAHNTLWAKRNSGGGHTGWSAVWEAALWARLRSPEEAFGAAVKFVRTFVAPNLLALHPPLDPTGLVECSTCFGESGGMRMQRRQLKERHIAEQLQELSSRRTVPLVTAETLSRMEDTILPQRGMVMADQSKVRKILCRTTKFTSAVTLIAATAVPHSSRLTPTWGTWRL